MNDHYLLKNAVDIPTEFNSRSNTPDSNLILFLTKTLAAPGDDDDDEDWERAWSSWGLLFF